MSEKTYDVKFEESEFWLSHDEDMNALYLEYRSMELYAPLAKASKVMNGDEDKILFEEVCGEGDEMESLITDVEFRLTSSGKSIIIGESQLFDDKRDEHPLIAPKRQIERLKEGEIQGVKLSYLKGA